MTNWVTVKVPEADRERAKEYRPDGATYGDCLVAGAERLNEHLDSDTSLSAGANMDTDALAASIRDYIDPDFPVADVKEAVREVLREELPEGALRP